jgi:hypothetical protein
MSNHTTRTALPPPHLRWWQCDHEGPGIEGCPVCRKVPDKGAAMWAAGLLRALDRESLALVGSLAAERDRERRRAEAAEAALATARAEGAAAERADVVALLDEWLRDAPGGPSESINRHAVRSVIAAGAHVRPVEGA